MKLRSVLLALAATVCLATTANATTITFESIGLPNQATATASYNPGTGNYGFITDGFYFDRADVVDLFNGSWGNGAGHAGHSGRYSLLNDWGGTVTMTAVGGGTFSVQDLWMNGWQGSFNTTTFSGYLGGSLVSAVTANYSAPWTDITLNFAGIDKLTISSSGIFLVDDVSVNGSPANNNVPEPATLALLGMGLAGLGALRRRKA